MRRVGTLCLLLVLAAPAAGPGEPLLTHVDVFTSGTEGYHTFRIPAVETAPDGSLIALAEARKYHSGDPGFHNNDIDLVCKRSTDGGQTWSALQVLDDPGEKWSACNPVTVVDRDTRRVWVSTAERLLSDEAAAYSDMTVLKDKTVGVLWERGGYRWITFSRFNLEFLDAGNPPREK